VEFEWDIEKEKTNWIKHKIAFREACYVFTDKCVLTLYDEEHSGDEDRWITIGQSSLSGSVLVVVHTYRINKDKEYVRIISGRRVTKNEEKQYFKRRS